MAEVDQPLAVEALLLLDDQRAQPQCAADQMVIGDVIGAGLRQQRLMRGDGRESVLRAWRVQRVEILLSADRGEAAGSLVLVDRGVGDDVLAEISEDQRVRDDG